MKHIIWLLALVSSIAMAIPYVLHIGQVSVDDSNQLKIVYSGGGMETTLTDAGPAILCLLNRLLTNKYGIYQTLPENQTVSHKDLAMLWKAAHLLPQKEGSELVEAIRSYMREPSETSGNKLVRTLHGSIYSGLKEHKTHFRTARLEQSPVAAEQQVQLAKVEKRIEAILADSSEDTLEPEEKALFQKWDKQRKQLREQIAAAKPVTKVEEGEESPADYYFCVKDEMSRSRTGIDNGNVDELLTDTKAALDRLVPDGTKTFSIRTKPVHTKP